MKRIIFLGISVRIEVCAPYGSNMALHRGFDFLKIKKIRRFYQKKE